MNSLNILGLAWTFNSFGSYLWLDYPFIAPISSMTFMTWSLGLIGVWTLVQLHHFINNLD